MVKDVAIILCAGGSTRMGSPKALLSIEGEPVIYWHLRAFREVVEHCVVVLGAGAPAIRAVLPPEAHVIENRHWASTTPIDSLRLALATLPRSSRVWVAPVDTPPADPTTLSAMRASAPAVPRGPDGRDGHPVLLGPMEIEAVLQQAAPDGLRGLLMGSNRVIVSDPTVSWDFDDPPAFQRLLNQRALRS